jgi:hypothetical protein
MSVSSNSAGTVHNLILWVVTAATSSFTSKVAGTLRALDVNLNELWNSGSTLGTMAKFVSPTIANGRVYVPTNDNTLMVFGLTFAAQMRGQTTMRGAAVIR